MRDRRGPGSANQPFPPAPSRGEKILLTVAYTALLVALASYFGAAIWVAFQ